MEYSAASIDNVDELMQKALSAMDTESPSSREKALAKTNLEQAIMWYRKDHFKNNLKGELQRGQQTK